LLALSGCVTTEFVTTDPSFRARVHLRPVVYIDRLPPFAYRSVGIIEATIPEGHGLAEVLDAVVTKGEQVGCEAIVDRAIHRVSAAPVADSRHWMVVQYHPPVTTSSAPIYRPAQPTYNSAPAGRREFVCAVREGAAPVPPVVPVAPVKPAPENTAL
jgi:hypothetical protein